MAEENQVQQQMSNQVQQTTEEPQQVTTKNPKKVEAGKRLAEYNRRKSEAQKSEVSQYYGIGAVLAVGVICGLGYYVYSKEGATNNIVQQV